MTVTLTQDTATAKVGITVDGASLGAARFAQLERSINQVGWTTVRGGIAVSVPLGGLSLPGITGNYASTPDTAVLDIVGDVDLRVEASLNDWTPASGSALVAKWNEPTNNRSYLFYLNTDGTLHIIWSANGSAAVSDVGSTVPVPFSAAGQLAVRVTLDVDNGAAGRTITFYTAATIAGPWTQLGAPVIQGGVTSIFSGAALGEVGAHSAGTLSPLTGTVLAAEIRSGINGTAVANPVFWKDAPTGATSFVDAAGRTWTKQGTASITRREVTLDDYEFAPGVTNYYRASAASKGLYLPAAAGNYASTPDNAALDITGDIDLRADATLNGWVTGALQALVAKFTRAGNQRAYRLGVNGLGQIEIIWSANGTAELLATSTVPVPVTSGRLAIRATMDVDNGAGGRTITFYTAPNLGGPWTQLGATVVTAGTTSIFNSTAIVEIGSDEVGTLSLAKGIVHAVEIRGGINGTAVANPDFTAQAHLAASFVDAAGRTWTMNGTGQILTTQSATIVPVLDRIWLKSLTRPFLNRVVTVVGFTDPVRPARSTEHDVIGRTMPAARNDIRGSRRWSVDLRTATAADRQTMDYILASGDVLLLHVPRGVDVPGGYVQVKNYGHRRPDGNVRGAVRIFSLPLVESAPPGPDVAATIGTWSSVLAGYASWDAVLAAFPTWEDLLQLHGDPAEVIVP